MSALSVLIEADPCRHSLPPRAAGGVPCCARADRLGALGLRRRRGLAPDRLSRAARLANPWQVGRSQIAREYSSADFDALLERIESASLRWEGGEAQPGPGWPYASDEEAQRAEDDYRLSGWSYANASDPDARGKPGRRR